jgi:hypothetical protein
LIQSDIDHKYSFKVDVTQFGQATFVYINPGTTASGLLTMQKLSADNTRVSIGRGWIPRSKLQYTRLGEGQSVTFETISSSSSGVTGNEGPPGIENVNNVGGIDFTDYEKSLIIEDESPNLPVMIFPPLQEQLKNVPGFVPVIINIEPLYSVPAFLGMEQAPAAPAVLKLTS